jgi:hypothetical protein
VLACELVHLDCLSLPAALGQQSVICDPPYGKHVHDQMVSCAASGGRKGVRQRDVGFDPLSEELRAHIVSGVAAAPGWSAIFCDVEGDHLWRDPINAAVPSTARSGKTPRKGVIRTVTWDESIGEGEHDGGYCGALPWIRWSSPQQSGDRPVSDQEQIVLAHGPGRMIWTGPTNRSYMHNKCERGQDKHTTAKPLDLMLELVAYLTAPGDLVVDYCAGRGTTGVACALLRRSFLGFETNIVEAELGQYRISEAINGRLSPRDQERTARACATFQCQPDSLPGLVLVKGKAPA